MARFHKDPSKSDLIVKFFNTYLYFEYIFTLNNPDFFKYTAEIIPKELNINIAI